MQGLDRQARWWPVMGPLHEDSEAFRFHLWHYHVDPQRLTWSTAVHVSPTGAGSGTCTSARMAPGLTAVMAQF